MTTQISPAVGASLTIGAILIATAILALIETRIPLHSRGRWHRAHLRPNLALTFATLATNVFLNAALVSLLQLLHERGFGILRWASLDPVAADDGGAARDAIQEHAERAAHHGQSPWVTDWPALSRRRSRRVSGGCGLCYRMTGNRADADELAQEAIARAIERADQITSEDPTGWLLLLPDQPSPENALVLQEDIRFAIVVAL